MTELAAVIALGGCASPGPPLPPTLNLPQVPSGTTLSAMRIGNEVKLHWTTPNQSTDKLPIRGAITAEICRATEKMACIAVERTSVAAGASDAVDRLPATLISGPAQLLTYRVQLLNSAGRTAGQSQAVFSVAGEPLSPVEGFSGGTNKDGVTLRWRAGTANGGGTSENVELDRTTLDPAPGSDGLGAVDPRRKSALLDAHSQAAETRFRAGAQDVGGALDRTVEVGHSYRYTAQRVVTVELAGHKLEARSVPSKALVFAVRDEFSPDVPSGLVAVPGFAGEGDAQRPTIELSWNPDVEPHLAGYRVYRREVSADNSTTWVRLGSQTLTTAAYRDLTVAAGHRYAYRVTAVSTGGHESAPSGEASEEAAEQ